MHWTDIVGWIATASFLSSYAFRNPKHLRMAQAASACIWIAYAIGIRSNPVLVTNILVFVIAIATTLRQAKTQMAAA